MRAALYARVSTKDKGQDTENQMIALREYCARAGWEVVEEYIDRESAKNGNRGAFKQLFADASRRSFDVVVVWALDRLTREGVHQTFGYIEQLKQFGVAFESYTEPHFRTTGPAGELMLAVAAWIAKQERQRLSERTIAGLERARRAGRIGGRPRVVVDRERLAELDEEGWTVREIGAEMGISAASVSRLLKAHHRLQSPAAGL